MSKVLARFPKQPVEILDFDFDFTEWLADREDVIAGATVVAEPGLTVDYISRLGGVVKVWLSGGTHLTTYKVTATVTTGAGRTKQAEIAIKVREV